ncbi:MAG TPA: hypothetical protein VHK88_20585, partial [Aquihabitans sp.]|nr:hypothetical protein [Aquihabitans sp.]
MARDEVQGDPERGAATGRGATEPITLTDPDGAVTRVAPWSSWTREQVRAPGGEPALVTRLEHGQLWFAAGRTRSPWRHEVHVGPAIVSTPRGRFQATAEADGGATIACLSGRTRVVAGLREPVLLEPDQSAAVSSDGATLVVMDRPSGDERSGADERPEREAGGDAPSAAAVPAFADSDRDHDLDLVLADADLELGRTGASADDAEDAGEVAEVAGGGPEVPTEPLPARAPDGPDRRRLRWVPELVAVAALLGVLVAAVIVFAGSGSDDDTQVAQSTGAVTTEAERTATTEGGPASTEASTPEAPTTEVPTTAAPTTEAP